MANTKSAQKSVRQTSKRRLRNRLHGKTMRNAVKRLRQATKKEEALAQLPQVISLIDKQAKRGTIHWKKAANLKSKLMRRLAMLK
ncbi:MAG: 30S ribosomal protein S20 [Chitinophagales bacterium]|nr:30S ribosomal protein S20 [Chitinophagales bacterium]MDW8427007.1 30S ribosomal protein S20 [Chitinophagales bacterium]